MANEKETKTQAQEAEVTETKIAEAVAAKVKTADEAAFDEKKEKAPKEFASFKQAQEVYQEAQALNLLRKKIFQYKEIDQKFLTKIGEENAFKLERVYVSVARVKGLVRYSWETKANGEVHTHSDIKTMEKTFSDEAKLLDALNFPTDNLMKAEIKKEVKLFEQKKYTCKQAMKQFETAAKSATPNKKAKVETRKESYELIYIPVLKASCVYEGETYVGYVNLVNGACVSDYKTSERLNKAVNDVMSKVKSARQWTVSSLLFTLLLCAMAFVKAWWPTWDKWDANIGWVVIVLGCIALVPLLCLIWLAIYKPAKMKEKAVATGRMPSAAAAWVAVAIGWVACVAAVVLFFLKVLVVNI